MAAVVEQARRGSAKEYYERITQLIATTQVSAAEAAKTVAEEFGKTENAVLGSYYRHARKLKTADSTPAPRGRGGARRQPGKSVDGYLADAKTAFESALKQVSADVEDAQAELDRVKDRHSKDLTAFKGRQAKELAAAKTKLDRAKATAKAEKTKLEEKIKLLSS